MRRSRRTPGRFAGAPPGPAGGAPILPIIHTLLEADWPAPRKQHNVDPRKAAIAYGCNVDTLMRHDVALDEQAVTDAVTAQLADALAVNESAPNIKDPISHSAGRIHMQVNDKPPQGLALRGFISLPGLDSNQDKENQNLLCYRYTTG